MSFDTSFEGFYVVYITGAIGSSLALFAFKDRKIAGADIGGGKYKGIYAQAEKNDEIQCTIDFSLGVGQQSITGVSADSLPIKTRTVVTLPVVIDPKAIFRIETQIGPVNARFEKIHAFTDGDS